MVLCGISGFVCYVELLDFQQQIVKCVVGRDTKGVFIGCDFIAGFSENIFDI